MKTRIGFAAFLFVVLVGASAWAQPRAGLLPPVQRVQELQQGQEQPKQKGKDKEKKTPEKKLTQPPETDAFTVSPFARADLGTGYKPHMMGDPPPYFSRTIVVLPVLQFITTTTTTTIPGSPKNFVSTKTTTSVVESEQSRTLLVPASVAGQFKVADNASPRPLDRVYFTFNFFNDIRGPQNNSITQTAVTSTPVRQLGNGANVATTTTTTTVFPAAPYVNLYRETFGLEKTFLDGRASLEARLPILLQPSSVDGFQFNHVGDVTFIGKYAFLLDRDTGDVISGGLAVTAPTGPGIRTIDGTIHSTLLQPWGGYILNFDRFYFQGFHSAVFPTDSRDITFLFNDVGLNYWLYMGDGSRPLNFVVPTAEIHVTTPLSNRGGNDPLYSPDLVVFTGGVHLGLFRSSTLTLGAATPITGPRVFGVEAFVQFNWLY